LIFDIGFRSKIPCWATRINYTKWKVNFAPDRTEWILPASEVVIFLNPLQGFKMRFKGIGFDPFFGLRDEEFTSYFKD